VKSEFHKKLAVNLQGFHLFVVEETPPCGRYCLTKKEPRWASILPCDHTGVRLHTDEIKVGFSWLNEDFCVKGDLEPAEKQRAITLALLNQLQSSDGGPPPCMEVPYPSKWQPNPSLLVVDRTYIQKRRMDSTWRSSRC